VAEEEILREIENQPQLSTRRLANQVGVSRFVVWRTLKEQGLHPYHVQKVQALKPEDFPRRIYFCEWLLANQAENPNFAANILATDEAGFSRNGIHNGHNTHIWSDEN
ncbi:HTH Tnp Tc3 2 domain containing protein, partial [Asbolus verrucosus]